MSSRRVVAALATAAALAAVSGCSKGDVLTPQQPGGAPAATGSAATPDLAPPAAPDAGRPATPDLAPDNRGVTVRRTGPRELVVSLVAGPPGDGPCGSRLRAVATETPTQVRLRVVDDARTRRSGGDVACRAIGHSWSLPVALQQDLGSRAVVDSEGRPFQLAVAFAPTRLPGGYGQARESGSPGQHTIAYRSPDGGVLLVITWPEGAPPSAQQAFTAAGQREADGRTFQLLQNGLQKVVAFEVDGRPVWVSSVRSKRDSDAGLDWPELVDVAASVR